MAHGYMTIRVEHNTNCDGVFGEFYGTHLMDQNSYTSVDNSIKLVQKLLKKYSRIYVTFSSEEIGRPDRTYGRIAKWPDSDVDWMYWDKSENIQQHDETETATNAHIKNFMLEMIEIMKAWNMEEEKCEEV